MLSQGDAILGVDSLMNLLLFTLTSLLSLFLGGGCGPKGTLPII
jgi:hypothetical protein